VTSCVEHANDRATTYRRATVQVGTGKTHANEVRGDAVGAAAADTGAEAAERGSADAGSAPRVSPKLVNDPVSTTATATRPDRPLTPAVDPAPTLAAPVSPPTGER